MACTKKHREGITSSSATITASNPVPITVPPRRSWSPRREDQYDAGDNLLTFGAALTR